MYYYNYKLLFLGFFFFFKPHVTYAPKENVNLLWNDAVRGIEDGEAAEGAEGVCAVCLCVRLARYASLEGLACKSGA